MNPRRVNDVAWGATGKLVALVAAHLSPEQQTDLFHKAFEVVVETLGEYDRQTEREHQRLYGEG